MQLRENSTKATLFGQLDSGADINLISCNILEQHLGRNWTSLPNASSSQSVETATGSNIRIISVKIMTFNFTSGGPIEMVVYVTSAKDLFLLGAPLHYQLKISINWDLKGIPVMSWEEKHQTRHCAVYTNPPSKIINNVYRVVFQPLQLLKVEFSSGGPLATNELLVIENVGHQLDLPVGLRALVVLPSTGKAIRGKTYAYVKNLSTKPLELAAGTLPAWAIKEPYEEDTGVVLTDLDFHQNRDRTMAELRQACPVLPHYPGLRPLFVRRLASVHDDYLQPKLQVNLVQERALEKELARLYTPNEEVDFNQQIQEEDITLPMEDKPLEWRPEDAVPYDGIEEPLRIFAKVLMTKHSKILSKGPFDFGWAKSVDEVELYLKKPLPEHSGKVYHGSPEQQEKERCILSLLLKKGLLNRSKATFGCPIFFISKSTANSVPRFLVDTSQLNEYLVDTPQILPTTESILRGLNELEPILFSSIDLRSAYFSLRLSKRSQKFMVINTSFGAFSSQIALQGLRPMPGIFQTSFAKVIHSDPKTRLPDPLFGANNYLDDCFTATGTGDTGMLTTIADKFPELRSALELSQLSDRDKADACLHYSVADELMRRIGLAGFKISPEKTRIFSKELRILGHLVQGGRITVDPKRIDKMRNFPVPTSKVELQRFLGFVSSIKAFSRPSLGEAQAHLTRYVGTKEKSITLTPEDVQHFYEARRELCTEHFRAQSDPHAPKLLFTDSSSVSLGCVMMDLVAPELVLHKTAEIPAWPDLCNAPPPEVVRMALQAAASDPQLHIVPLRRRGNRTSSFLKACLSQIALLRIRNLPFAVKAMRGQLISFLTSSVHRLALPDFTREDGTFNTGKWDHTLCRLKTETNDERDMVILAPAVAALTDRELMVIGYSTKHPVRWFRPSNKAAKKPPMVVLRGGYGDFFPFQGCAYYHPLQPSTLDTLQFDHKFEDAKEIIGRMKEFVLNQKTSPYKAVPIAYHSKVIARKDRFLPIYQKEATALVQSLHSLESEITRSCITLAIVDSRSVYFLYNHAINQSQHKVRRQSVLLATRYPSLHFMAVPSNKNAADYLSRLVAIDEEDRQMIDLRKLHIQEAEALEWQIFSTLEAENACSNLPTLHAMAERNIRKAITDPLLIEPDAKEREKDSQEKVDATACVKALTRSKAKEPQHGIAVPVPRGKRKLTKEETTILRNTLPLRALAEMLQTADIASHQDSYLNQETIQALRLPLVRNEQELWALKRSPERVYIPPALEGKILSYLHLRMAHAGSAKIYVECKAKYYFPKMLAKATQLAQSCQACMLVNPLTGNSYESGSYPFPKYPFEVISVDILEGLPKNTKGIVGLLNFVDTFSGLVYIHELLSAKVPSIVAGFRSFFKAYGLNTKICLTDNGPNLLGARPFLSNLGIKCPTTCPYISQSRGKIESFNKSVNVAFRKALVISERYDFDSVLFLVNILINESVNPVTGISPNQMVFGRSLVDFGPLGIQYQGKDYFIAKPMLQDFKLLRKQLETDRIKRTTRENDGKKTQPGYTIGDLVLIKDRRIPVPGTNTKLRTKFYPSVFEVTKTSHYQLQVKRLTDGFLTAVRPSQIKSLNLPADDLKRDLPPSVLDIMGQPLTKDSLKNLLKEDTLPIIYGGDVVTPIKDLHSSPTVASTSQEQQRVLETDEDVQDDLAFAIDDEEGQNEVVSFSAKETDDAQDAA